MVNKADKDKTEEQQKKQSRDLAAQAVGLATAISAELAGTTVSGYYFGHFLDGKCGTAPWLMLAGVLLGLAVGFAVVLKTLQRFL